MLAACDQHLNQARLQKLNCLLNGKKGHCAKLFNQRTKARSGWRKTYPSTEKRYCSPNS